MDVLADANVPAEQVAALRGDGHDIVYSRDVDDLGPTATDDDILDYAARTGRAVLTADAKDFADRDIDVPVFIAPQGMSGGDVRAAVARIIARPFDPATADPLWLSAL